MKQQPIEGDFYEWVVTALKQTVLFGSLSPADTKAVIAYARLIQYQPDEQILEQGDESDSFLLLLSGEASVQAQHQDSGRSVEIGLLEPGDTIGEMGLLLQSPRTASVFAKARSYVLEFSTEAFDLMFEKLPGFSRTLSRSLAFRLYETSRQIPLPKYEPEEGEQGPAEEVIKMIPSGFITRHRVIPLKKLGDDVTVGFVDDPTPEVMSRIQDLFPGAKIEPRRMTTAQFEAAVGEQILEDESDQKRAEPVRVELKSTTVEAAGGSRPELASLTDAMVPDRSKLSQELRRVVRSGPTDEEKQQLERLEPMLRAMIQQGASDLHLPAQQKPRIRIDGDLYELADSEILREQEVLDMLVGAVPDRNLQEFAREHDTDFTYAAKDIARFRVNLYRDDSGISAAMRLIPVVIPSMEQLGLPDGARRMTALGRGLVLVTGPTGSGKSTTLAAMINSINESRRRHIITLEDPIEFLHESKMALVNQREVGNHSSSFARALRAALREDPDVVLVGELRDLETVSLAMETANTGHLVFGTLHTNTAIGTIDRVVDLFPAQQQSQARSVLSEVLKGVVSQILCPRIGGGRVAAFEVLIVSSAIANMIRQGKTHQIASAMSTGRAYGNCILNDDLFELVEAGIIEPEQAIAHAVDRDDLKQRLGVR